MSRSEPEVSLHLGEILVDQLLLCLSGTIQLLFHILEVFLAEFIFVFLCLIVLLHVLPASIDVFHELGFASNLVIQKFLHTLWGIADEVSVLPLGHEHMCSNLLLDLLPDFSVESLPVVPQLVCDLPKFITLLV